MFRRGASFLYGFLALAVWAGALLTPAPARAEVTDVRTVGGVIDYAKLFTPEEKREIEVTAGPLARWLGTDVFVVTVDDRAGQWASLRSHYAMVAKVLADVKAALQKHFQRQADLTVLVVFKSSVVLHLTTERTDLNDALMMRNFYGGASGAWDRIRGKDERHAPAALRYLATFTAIAAENKGGEEAGLALFVKQTKADLLKSKALMPSRNLVAHPWLEPAFRVFYAGVNGLTSILPLPGWVGFLIVLMVLHLSIHAIERGLEWKFGRAGEMAGNLFLVALLFPPLGFLFAVAQGDLENLLYVSQVFGGDLFTYLSWSEAIASRAFRIAFWIIAMVAGAAFVMEVLKGFVRHQEMKAERAAGTLGIIEQRVPKRLSGVWSLGSAAWHWIDTFSRALAGVILVVSLVVWPGLIAAYFLLFAFFSRVPGVVRFFGGAKPEPFQPMRAGPQMAISAPRGAAR